MLLMIQPVIASVNQSEDCCIENGCKKESDENKKCDNKDCNPFMSCSLFNLICETNSQAGTFGVSYCKEKILVKDDNRIVKKYSSFWNPPKHLS